MTTMYQALDVFKDHLPDIINAMSANLQEDIRIEKEDAIQLGTGWVADEVRKLRIANKFEDRTRNLKLAVNYYKALQQPARYKDRITDIDIARAREYPITDLHAGKLRKHGITALGLCPFHEDSNPSLNINIKKNLYYCFVCAEGGDSIKYYMKTRKVQFKEAVRALSKCG